MDLGLRSPDVLKQDIPRNEISGKAHERGCYAHQDNQRGHEGQNPSLRNTRNEARTFRTADRSDKKTKVRNNKSTISDTGKVLRGSTWVLRGKETNERGRQDPVPRLHRHREATIRGKCPLLPHNADSPVCSRPPSVFQVPQMEPYHEILQSQTTMLPLWQTRTQGRPPSLRLLQENGDTDLHKLSGITQPGLQRMSSPDSNSLRDSREDGPGAPEENSCRPTRGNSSSMDDDLKECPGRDQPGEGLPCTPDNCSDTSSPTTETNKHTKETRTAKRIPCNSNGDGHSGTYVTPNEDRGHNQRINKVSSSGSLQKSRTGSERGTDDRSNRPSPRICAGQRTDKNIKDKRNSSPSSQGPNKRNNKNPKNLQKKDTNTGNITIISWNIRGFRTNKNLLLEVIQDKEPEIIMLQETMTRKSLHPKLPGYIIYHKPRKINTPTVETGLITAVRADIPHDPTPIFTTNTDWETLTITLQGFNNTTINLINTYVRPKHLLNLDEAISGANNFLLAGDLNANSDVWGSANTRSGRHLLDQLNTSNYILINDPKVPTTTYGSTLDLVIVSPQISTLAHWNQNDTLTSDHIANSIEIVNSFLNIPKSPVAPKWITNKANWDLFAHKLSNLHELDPNPTIDQRLKSILNDLNTAAIASVPQLQTRATRAPRSFLPPEAKIWTKQVSDLTKIFKADPSPRNKQKLRLCQQITKKQLFILKNKQWDIWCTKLSEMRSTQVWKEIKKIRASAPTAKTVIPKQEANRLAHHFTTRADENTLPQNITSALNQQRSKRHETITKAKQQQPNTDKAFTLHELDSVLGKNRNSAPGEDNFTYAFYTNAPISFKNRILNLFNQSWSEGKLPEQWKTATVIPIPKPGGRGHRPISLLSTLSKIMERMILARLQWKIPKAENIFGFVKDRSTLDPILHLVTKITARKTTTRNKPVFVAFMDLDKAFERADHLSILDSLISLGVSGRIITWIEDFLKNRKMKVKVQGAISDLYDLTTGSPQGSSISPSLFNCIISLLISVTLPPSVDILAYADDLVLIAHGRAPATSLQKALNIIDKAANNLGLYFSPAKTKTMAFHTNSRPHFQLGTQHLENVDHYRYLGVYIDTRLNFNRHIKEVKRKIDSRFNIIKIITNMKIGLNTPMLITLYNSLIQSVFLYAAPVLLLASDSAIQTLETSQRTILRYILGLPNNADSILVYKEAGIIPIHLLIKKETAKYLIRSATKPVQTANITRVQQEIIKDPRVHNGASWSTKAAWLQKEIGIPRIKPPNSQRPPPWENPPIHVIIKNPVPKKADPEGAGKAASDRIKNLNYNTRQTYNIYTDASAQSNGNTAWACYIEETKQEIKGRILDHTPITLAELHAIKAALTWITDQNHIERVIIHSDSMGALTIIATSNFQTYPEITTQIHNTATTLKHTGTEVVIHWVPSHVNLDGNEKADTLANEATSLTNILHAEHTPGTFNHLIDNFISDKFDSIYTNYSSRYKDWYHNTTVPGLHFQTNRLTDVQLRRLRFWTYTRKFTNPPTPTLCPHCQQPYNPIHYLLNCPAKPTDRRRLRHHLTPEQFTYSDHHLAALIIRKTTILPDIIKPLFHSDPYQYHKPT